MDSGSSANPCATTSSTPLESDDTNVIDARPPIACLNSP